MGYVKELELSARKPVTVERRYALSNGIGVADISRFFVAWGDAILHENFRRDEKIRASLLAGIQRSFSVTNAEGTFTCDTLKQLASHLGRRRVERFVIRLRTESLRRSLLIRSDGTSVLVRSGGWDRAAAMSALEPVVLTLGLLSPANATPLQPRAATAPLKYDAFICHAGEDKAAAALPIRNGLKAREYEVWLDVFKVKVGDSLREVIDDGLRRSRHGIVILSPSFFKKKKVWPRRELDGLFSQEAVIRKRVILPVRHGMTHSQLARRSPMLAGLVAAQTDDGMETVVRELIASMGAPLRRRVRRASPGIRA